LSRLLRVQRGRLSHPALRYPTVQPDQHTGNGLEHDVSVDDPERWNTAPPEARALAGLDQGTGMPGSHSHAIEPGIRSRTFSATAARVQKADRAADREARETKVLRSPFDARATEEKDRER